MSRLRGMFANMSTALTDGGDAIDEGRMRSQVEWLLESGVHGLSTLLSAGEFAYLSLEERRQVARIVLGTARGRVPILVGVSANNTKETVELAKHALGLGASAAMVQPRSYFKLTESEVLQHYDAVVRAVDGAIGIYNNPFTTGVDISADLFRKLVGLGNVTVTKDSSRDIVRVAEVRATCPDHFSYLCGAEYQCLPALLLEADGCCIGINSVLPHEMLAIHNAVVRGDLDTARATYRQLLPILAIYRAEGVCRTSKAILEILGHSLGPHRPPLRAMPAELRNRLRAALSTIGALKAAA